MLIVLGLSMQMAVVVGCGVCGIYNTSQTNRRRARSKCLKNLHDSTFLDFSLSFQNFSYRDVTSTRRVVFDDLSMCDPC